MGKCSKFNASSYENPNERLLRGLSSFVVDNRIISRSLQKFLEDKENLVVEV